MKEQIDLRLFSIVEFVAKIIWEFKQSSKLPFRNKTLKNKKQTNYYTNQTTASF